MPVLPQQFMVACGKVMCVRFNLNRDARSSSTLYKSRALVPPDGFNLNRDARSSSTRSHDGPDHSNAGFQSQPRCPFFLNIACANSLVAHGGRFNLNRDARSSSTTNLIGYVVNEHPFQSQPRCPFFLNDLLRAIASGEVAFQSQPRCPFFLNKGEVFRSFRERKFQSQPRCPFFLNSMHVCSLGVPWTGFNLNRDARSSSTGDASRRFSGGLNTSFARQRS